jgi:hypothetical protein
VISIISLAFADAGSIDPNIFPSIWLRLVDSGLSFMLFGAAIYYFVRKESRTELLISSVIQENTKAILRLESLISDYMKRGRGRDS